MPQYGPPFVGGGVSVDHIDDTRREPMPFGVEGRPNRCRYKGKKGHWDSQIQWGDDSIQMSPTSPAPVENQC